MVKRNLFSACIANKKLIALAMIQTTFLLTACGGGGSGQESISETKSASTETSKDDQLNENGCLSTQFLENGICQNKTQQTISNFTLPSSLNVGDTYTLTAQSNLNLNILYSSSTTKNCTITGKQLTALSKGTCNITAYQTGNNQALAASRSISTKVIDESSIFLEEPNVQQCKAGQLTEFTKRKALNALNEVRALHGLAPVEYDYDSDEEVMQAALIMSANEKLNHSPTQSMRCFSAIGATGAATSNLLLTRSTDSLLVNPEAHISAWMTEKNSPSIGHRRWQLNPSLKKVAYGIVTQNQGSSYRYNVSGAMKVAYQDQSIVNANLGVIAYPQGNYPQKYFASGVPLSVSILNDQSNFWNNMKVDYSNTIITVTERGGSVQKTSDIQYDNQGVGLPNSLEFKLPSLKYNVIYDVHLDNVLVNGVPRSYDYWFRIK